MNLRIAPEHMRFRISEDEFATLREHGILSNCTSFGNPSRLNYAIRMKSDAANLEGQIIELSIQMNEGLSSFELTVFANGISQLLSGNVGKNGIQEYLAFENGDLLTVGLEIDLHSKTGKDKS